MTISTEGLSKSYGKFNAVNGLSLKVAQGEIYGFLGLNGAGKTTTIRMLLGMVRPSAGQARIFSKPVSADAGDIWRRVGYLVEKPSAYPELTVAENLEVMRRLRGVTDTQAVSRVIKLLALDPYARRRARTLSTGNAQRLGLAKALLHRPELLILDEPANGLDPAGVVEIRELLRRLSQQDGITIFMSSHILTEVSRLAGRIGIIHQGRLVEEMDAAEFERHQQRALIIDTLDNRTACEVLAEASYQARLTPDGALTLKDERALSHPEEIARLVVSAGIGLRQMQSQKEDLEAHFLRLVSGSEAAHGI